MVTNHARNRNTTSMLIHKLQDKFMYKYIKERELQLSMQGGNIDSQLEYS